MKTLNRLTIILLLKKPKIMKFLYTIKNLGGYCKLNIKYNLLINLTKLQINTGGISRSMRNILMIVLVINFLLDFNNYKIILAMNLNLTIIWRCQ